MKRKTPTGTFRKFEKNDKFDIDEKYHPKTVRYKGVEERIQFNSDSAAEKVER